MHIPFNVAACTGKEQDYINKAIEQGQLSGDNYYSKKCTDWFDQYFNSKGSLLTPSCTHALEMAAILIDIQVGDEVIMPSYTFVSTANAFVLRGAKIVFVDTRTDNMNIDESKIEAAITDKTKAIVPVHYAGVACDMDVIMEIANRYELYVIEDAAQAILSTYKGRPLGSIGHLSTFSFHTTKNITSGGEGGLLRVNDQRFMLQAELFREKGTDRSRFMRGEVDRYTWRSVGSSMLLSEIQAAYLWAQLESIEAIHQRRMEIWQCYNVACVNAGIKCSTVSKSLDSLHNAHIFYILSDDDNREFLTSYREEGVSAVSHYEPLHLSDMGRSYGRVSGSIRNTEHLSCRLIRLPIYYSMPNDFIEKVISVTLKLFN